ncbi:MAG TPA: apolipoprotein N-acyltransferase [Candidatus Angelobacter sp.]|nr:apolipoprotein N-acyltransferase [Candidatus Angelobacter sp.]
MRNIPTRAWVLACISSALQIFVFPKPALFFLSWICFTPLIYALLRGRGGEGELVDSEGRSLRPFTVRQGFFIAWLCGILFYLGTCYWVYPVMNGYGGLNVFAASLITLGFALIMGLHHGAFGGLVVLMSRRSSLGNRRPLLLAPFFWVAIEYFRDRVTGVPWLPLGSAQVNNIPFARIAEVTGVYGLSFAVMLVNCAFAAGLLLYGRRRVNLLISAAAAAIALQMGVFAKSEPFPATKEALLVQENVPVLDPDQWTPQLYDQTIGSLAQLSVPQNRSTADDLGLIVWPESPAPFFIDDPRLRPWLATIARDANSYLVVGSIGTAESKVPGSQQLLNSALIVGPRGRFLGHYDKIHLVPFGEYVPMQQYLFFAKKLTREVGDFARGTERKVFDIDGTRIGVFICYESIFPDEVRQFTANGARVLVNISNDGWYGETGAPFQHLEMARMRAIENHRWVLIATNNGVTASIDPYGRIVKRLPRNVRSAMLAPFSPQIETTFYVRYGDVFAWTCVVISILAMFLRTRIRAHTMIEARPA